MTKKKALEVAQGELAEDLGLLAFDTACALRDLIREYVDEVNSDIDVDELTSLELKDLLGESTFHFENNFGE